MTIYDFKDGKGLVPAHQHPNGGGWVADTATVDEKAFVGPDAKVFGNAKVTKTPVRIPRSDGYDFILVPCADGKERIIAGSRYFTYEEADKHWNKEHLMYAETTIILRSLKELYELQKTT